MKSTIKALAVATSFFVFSNIQAISQDSAKWWGIGTGAVTAVVVGGGTFLYCTDCMQVQPGKIKDCYWYHSDGNKMTINNASYLASAAAGLGVGALTGYLVYKYLLTQTPQARYLSAKKIIQNVLLDSLVETQFKTNEDMIKHINIRFGTSWPLVLARSYFESVARDLRYANKLLISAYDEAKKDSKSFYLCQKCEKLQGQIPVIIDLIANRMNVVVEHDDYKFQVKLHQNYLEEMKRQEHERREKEKDRLHEYHMHSDKIHQKDKDRKLKKDTLNANQGNVAVSVKI